MTNYKVLFGQTILAEADRKIEEIARNNSAVDVARIAVKITKNSYYPELYLVVKREEDYRLFSAEPHIRDDGHADWGRNRNIALMEGIARDESDKIMADQILRDNFPEVFKNFRRCYKLK